MTSGSASGDSFGTSVAIRGKDVAIGASGAEAAYVFEGKGVSWVQEAKLVAADEAPYDGFGNAVAIQGNCVVVGSPHNDGGVGAAYTFERGDGAWNQQAKLVASDGTGGDFFGNGIAVSGDVILIGAPFHGGGGSAYVFAAPQ